MDQNIQLIGNTLNKWVLKKIFIKVNLNEFTNTKKYIYICNMNIGTLKLKINLCINKVITY